MSTAAVRVLPSFHDQVERLVALGVPDLARLSAGAFRALIPDQEGGDALLVVHPDLVPVSDLTPLIEREGRPGFVVVDLADVDQFGPVDGVVVPDAPLYVVRDPDRGDAMANWSPDEALPAITGAGRTPLTTSEGASWLIQQPDVLARNRCFMTIGSRLIKANGTHDARTPAFWISNGTGRDGADRRHAPKLGWCWAGNRHTWLGFASGAERA